MSADADTPRPSWRQRLTRLIVAQLRQGFTPEKIALTLALGGVLAVFPILGSTTLLCALAAFALRLNQPIMQLLNYLCYPLQFLLLLPLYRAGESLGAPHLSLSIPQLMTRFQAGPWQFIKDFATVALGGVAAWCLLAPPVAALIYFTLLRPLRLLARRSAVRPANPATGS